MDFIVFAVEQKDIDQLEREFPCERLIRCRDCRFGKKGKTNLSDYIECHYHFTTTHESHYGDFFCANAEPKAGEQE